MQNIILIPQNSQQLSNKIGYSKEIIDECILKVSNKFNLSYKDVFNIINTLSDEDFELEIETDLNFTNMDYNIKKDDQSKNVVTFSEQEYLHRDFKNILYRRFATFDENSFIPDKFRGMRFWDIQKQIFNQLPNLENKNWTNQTLSYTRSNIASKHIIDCIIDPLVRKGLFSLTIPRKFIVVDATANIGGDTINFALNRNVSAVISYEILTPVYNMLVNNIKLYGLQNKVVTKNVKFDYKIPENSLVIIDPPFESVYNENNFNLSIDKMPIYYVAEKCLIAGAKCVMLTMPKNFKYNKKFAEDFNQNVTVYQMGDKNNKIFLVMRLKTALELNIPNFSAYKISTDNTKLTRQGKVNPYKCKVTKIEIFSNYQPPKIKVSDAYISLILSNKRGDFKNPFEINEKEDFISENIIKKCPDEYYDFRYPNEKYLCPIIFYDDQGREVEVNYEGFKYTNNPKLLAWKFVRL